MNLDSKLLYVSNINIPLFRQGFSTFLEARTLKTDSHPVAPGFIILFNRIIKIYLTLRCFINIVVALLKQKFR